MDSRETRPAPEEKTGHRALVEKIEADTGVALSPIRDASATQIAAATAKSTASVVIRTAVLRGKLAAAILAKLGLPALGASPLFSIPVVGLLLTLVVLVLKIAVRVVWKLVMPGVSAVTVFRRLIAKARERRRKRKRQETSR